MYYLKCYVLPSGYGISQTWLETFDGAVTHIVEVGLELEGAKHRQSVAQSVGLTQNFVVERHLT